MNTGNGILNQKLINFSREALLISYLSASSKYHLFSLTQAPMSILSLYLIISASNNNWFNSNHLLITSVKHNKMQHIGVCLQQGPAGIYFEGQTYRLYKQMMSAPLPRDILVYKSRPGYDTFNAA